ncbi:DUF4145 domain-containing protein [Planococcus lenghuensis]|uniref:Transposase n=1 Tax=Planococcus lenghuensis TaxID=2213202 RepID=A0A1Q2KVW6_9BACL|nr:DUF4145 domain-containing protein [Planococcus lenghuensis]AQQ52254.1 transposase [Planococcus lenghuensis]
MTEQYFYKFMEPLNEKLAHVARDLENSIFVSPRTMLTHARTFVETLLANVMLIEKIEANPWVTLKERLDTLSVRGYLTTEVQDALHHVRKIGNQAAHETRPFRISEALLSWEAIYIIVKWYMEVYGPIDAEVPVYKDPQPKQDQNYDLTELEKRLKELERLLKISISEPAKEKEIPQVVPVPMAAEPPGFTSIRTISYKGQTLSVPYFLRDAFLLPQRFDKSETFLIRLGAEQQARIMSELPENLEGIHKYVKRFNDKSDEMLFNELSAFIEEEKERRKVRLNRPGELFFFYKSEYIIVTEELAKVPLVKEEFSGIPSLVRQLQEDSVLTVGQLPQELVILAKYTNVGIGTVEKLFQQLQQRENDLDLLIS